MDIPIFIKAGKKLINISEVLYINKAKVKNVYIVQFKVQQLNIGVTQQNSQSQSIMFLSPDDYKDFQENLQEYYSSVKS